MTDQNPFNPFPEELRMDTTPGGEAVGDAFRRAADKADKCIAADDVEGLLALVCTINQMTAVTAIVMDALAAKRASYLEQISGLN
jgi:hypothetical protein